MHLAVMALLCRQSIIVQEDSTEMCSLISVRIMGSYSKIAQMNHLKAKNKVGAFIVMGIVNSKTF